MVDIGESGSGLRQAKVDGMKWQFPRAEWKRTLAMLDSGKALLLRRGGAMSAAEGQAFAGGNTTDVRHEIQLAPNLVPKFSVRLRVLNPVREKLIRVFPAMRYAQRDSRQKAEQSSGQRTLAVDREDNRRVELPRT